MDTTEAKKQAMGEDEDSTVVVLEKPPIVVLEKPPIVSKTNHRWNESIESVATKSSKKNLKQSIESFLSTTKNLNRVVPWACEAIGFKNCMSKRITTTQFSYYPTTQSKTWSEFETPSCANTFFVDTKWILQNRSSLLFLSVIYGKYQF